jgi:hypothetical protein
MKCICHDNISHFNFVDIANAINKMHQHMHAGIWRWPDINACFNYPLADFSSGMKENQ